MAKLTKQRVEALPIPASGQALYWDSQRPGFGVRVTAAGKRTYIAQGRVNGKTRRVTIGAHGLFTCDQAREQAEQVLREMTKGLDPIEEKRKKRAALTTLRDTMDDYLEHKSLKPSTQIGIREHVTRNFADWADKPVANITRTMCVTRFRELTKRAPGQANGAFRILRALLNWARETHATDDDEYTILAMNPVAKAFKSGQLTWNKELPRKERIPDSKVSEVWLTLQALRAAEDQTAAGRAAADIVAFLLLTGARWSEAAELTWDHVNLEEGWWHIADTKNHNPVTLPLSRQAREILAARPRVKWNDYVFPARSGRDHIKDPRGTMAKVSGAAGMHIRPHDLRRTFRHVAGHCGIEELRVKLLMNHVLSDVTTRHYTETSDLRYLAKEIQNIADWITKGTTV